MSTTTPAMVVAGKSECAASGTAGIQEALDALPKEGGVVLLPPGIYHLRRSIILRSNVTIRGEGPATVLTRPPQIMIGLVREAHGESKRFILRHTRGLMIGDQLNIRDRQNYGWWSAHVVITRIGENSVGVETRHGERKRRFRPDQAAVAVNWFPAFWLRSVQNVTIENLTIEGTSKKPRREICDFVVAAIHSRNSENIRILNITVRNWLGDGIGIQGGRGACVTGCMVEGCIGHGYHPGTGLTESIWANNLAKYNTRDGFFFCLRVRHATVTGNVFESNGRHGIGGLGEPDKFNVVANNICANNGCHGIEATGSVGNIIIGNILRNNSQKQVGRYAGLWLKKHRDNVVMGNLCIDDQDKTTQKLGFVTVNPAGGNMIEGNYMPVHED